MRRFLGRGAIGALAGVIGVVLGFGSAHRVEAAQHAYHLTEVYTNADGSVQFIEYVAEINGQTQITGRSIVASQNGVVNSFPFTQNLPQVIAGRKLLLATQGYVDLMATQPGLPAPNVVLPNNFIPFQGAGNITIDFLPEDARTGPVTFPASNLPTDGLLAMLPEANPNSGTPINLPAPPGTVPTRRGGSATLDMPFVIAENSPMNLAGQSGMIMPEIAAGLCGDLNQNDMIDPDDAQILRSQLVFGMLDPANQCDVFQSVRLQGAPPMPVLDPPDTCNVVDVVVLVRSLVGQPPGIESVCSAAGGS